MVKKTEYSALILVAVLLIHRLVVGTDLQVLLRVLLTLTSIFYLWFSFFLFNKTGILGLFNSRLRKSVPVVRLVFSVTMGFVYSFSFLGLLFAVSFYPGMINITIIALIINVLSIVACLILGFSNKDHLKFLSQFTIRSLVLSILFSVYLSIPIDRKLELLFSDRPSFIEAYNEYLDDPDNPEVQNRLKEERSAFR